MAAANLAFDERSRLERLHRLKVLDTDRDRRFDALTARAMAIFPPATMAAISLVDTDRQWFKSEIGLNVSETPRSLSFCAHAILGSRTLVVQDATLDRRFADNELVRHAPHIRFYAGAPLANGLGALCVIATTPYRATAAEIKALEALGRMVDTQLLMHGALHALGLDLVPAKSPARVDAAPVGKDQNP